MLPMLSDSISSLFFKVGEYVGGEDISGKLTELKKNEFLDKETIEDLKLAKFKILAEHALSYSPHYQRQLGDFDVNEIKSMDDIKIFSYLSKDNIRNNVNDIISSNPVSKLKTAKTSGSTGIPLAFPKDAVSRAYHYAAMFRGHTWYGLGIGDREARLWGVPVDFKGRVQIALKDYFLNRFREIEYNLSESTLHDFYLKIIRYKPRYIMGYSKMLTAFGSFLQCNNLSLTDVPLKMVKFTSENMEPSGRAVIEETCGCPVVSEYGSAETGIISFQCPHGGHHLMSDCVHVEYLDAEGYESEFKEIVITDLNNLSFPIIRYRVGDLVIPSDKECTCKRPFPLLESIHGRSSDTFTIDGAKYYHSIVFYYVMKGVSAYTKNIVQFKVVQKAPDLFCYMLICSDRKAELENYIEKKTKQELGDSVSVEIVYVDNLPREQSGKLKDFIPYDGRNED